MSSIIELKLATKETAYLSHIGSALAGSDVIDVNWLTGASKFIMFGSAGSLESDITTGKFVIPTKSYREEGVSYHYTAPADYIEIKNAFKVKRIFDALNLPNVTGKVWTTDAFYRETMEKVKARRGEGCIAVEMELAGVQAVCDFYGWDLYDFLVTGDVLDQAVYDIAGLANANHEFVALLKQENTDSSKMAEVIGVSDAQLRFVTNSQFGMGLLKCGNVVIPFDNQISKDTSFYKLYNINLHEIIQEQKAKEEQKNS